MRALLLLTLLAAVPARAQAPAGGAWSPYGSGTPFPVDALALGPGGTPYALGTVPRVGTAEGMNLVARWDGSAWPALPPVIFCGFRPCTPGRALVIGPDGAIYASVSNTLPNGSSNSVQVWRGTEWTYLFGFYPGVAAVLRFAPDAALYVGGLGVSGPQNPVARLAGSTLAPVGMLDGFYAVYALAVAPGGVLYAGGYFGGDGSPRSYEARVARWDGTSWTSLGTVGAASSSVSIVNALAVAPDGTLYAGGSFTGPGGLDRVARWDGAAWQPLGAGIGAGPSIYDGAVRALAVTPDGALYAAGTFTTAGGAPANRIARWDGATWSALGSGLDGPATSLAVAPDGALVVGGAFATAGGVAAANVARYSPAPVAGEAAPDGPAAASLDAPSPNPAAGRVQVRYAVAGEGRVRLSIIDVLGREVAVVVDAEQAAGRHEATVEGGGLPAGVYVVRLSAGGSVATRRLTVAR